VPPLVVLARTGCVRTIIDKIRCSFLHVWAHCCSSAIVDAESGGISLGVLQALWVGDAVEQELEGLEGLVGQATLCSR
jgi:hypothetical protein